MILNEGQVAPYTGIFQSEESFRFGKLSEVNLATCQEKFKTYAGTCPGLTNQYDPEKPFDKLLYGVFFFLLGAGTGVILFKGK